MRPLLRVLVADRVAFGVDGDMPECEYRPARALLRGEVARPGSLVEVQEPEAKETT